MSTHITRAARSQLGADILLRLYERITGETLDGIRYPSQLSGIMITRAQIETTEYESLSDIILELRNVYSASGMRCLRSDAATRKSPVLNLIRQVARANGLALVSDRKPSGYAPDGRKQFIYWYKFESLDGDYALPPDVLPRALPQLPTRPAPIPDSTEDTPDDTPDDDPVVNVRDNLPNIHSKKTISINKISTEPAEEDIISGTIILPKSI